MYDAWDMIFARIEKLQEELAVIEERDSPMMTADYEMLLLGEGDYITQIDYDEGRRPW